MQRLCMFYVFFITFALINQLNLPFLRLIFLNRTAMCLILITIFSGSYSQTIEKKTYQTAFTNVSPEIAAL
jgi:hypothetical protein